MKRSLPSALALVIAVSTASAGAAVHNSPVHVATCQPSANVRVSGGWAPGYYPAGPYYWPTVYGYRYYQPPVRTANPTLAIGYTNNTPKVMKQVEFGLVANGNLVAEVKDVGTFSPGVEIKHEFGLSPNVFPIQTGLPKCIPLKITFEDGTKWRSPHLPILKHKLGL
jgi:hypothetical protein